MIKKWGELLTNLEINEQEIKPKDIDTLKKWIKKNVSEEIKFNDLNSHLFGELKSYLSNFFEKITANLQDGLVAKHIILRNMSVLQFAALQGYDKFINNLFKEEANRQFINDATDAGMTALHFAALNGHLKTVELLLSYGANPSLTSRLGLLPLHACIILMPFSTEAVKTKKIQIFNTLVETAPQTLEIVDKSGNTIAHFIAENNFSKLISLLQKRQPELIVKTNNFKRSPLHVAILNRKIETVRELVQIPELLEIADEDGRKPIHYAARYGNLEMLKIFANYLDLNVTDQSLKTPLHYAAETGNKDTVMYLIQRGANIKQQDNLGFNALHYAANSMNLELIKWIVENTDIDINQVDKKGRSALFNLIVDYEAGTEQKERIISYLIDKGADLHSRDSSGEMMLDYVDHLEQKGIEINAELLNKLRGNTLSI